MWFVYVLQDIQGKVLFTGATKDLDEELERHVSGKVRETTGRGDMKCDLYIALPSQKLAKNLVIYFKTPEGKKVLRTRMLRGK